MSEKRRRRRGLFDLFNENFDSFFKGMPSEGSSYSLTVTYDSQGKPIVKVKHLGNIDKNKLRRDIEQQYPGAKIEFLDEEPLIKVIKEKKFKPEKKEEDKEEK